MHSAPLGFSTQTKSSEDGTSFSTCYDVKEVGISQEKHLSLGFPLSYHLNSAGQAALVGRLAGTGFSTQTKSSKDETFISNNYDV